MIIKGSSRSGPSGLADHLNNTTTNERVKLIEARGTVAQDLRGALIEMDAYAAGSRCEKPLYHANIDPQPPYRLTPEQIIESVDALEKRLGLEGHPRVIVLHEKHGREHIHPVWARIDLATMTAVHDGHNYRKHEEVARDLERRFGHERVQGAHVEREGVKRPDRTPSRSELRQEERTGIKGKDVKTEVTLILRASDDAKSFRAALADAGYILAPGDRRDFVIVDRKGGIHSLARRIDGMKAAELREFMAPIDRDSLPTLAQAKEFVEERRQHILDSRKEANLEKKYSRAENYVSQTQTALDDYIRRQKALNKEPRPQRPSEPTNDGTRVEEIVEASDRNARKADEELSSRANAKTNTGEERITSKFDNVEMTEAQQQRMQRLLNNPDSGRDYDENYERDPDRQQETPGGGHTRGR